MNSKNISHVDELYEFEQKEIKVRKFIWILLVLLWVSGSVGLFGKGWLSGTKIEGNGYELEYERFLRDETSTSIIIFLEESSADTIEISFGKKYVKKIRFQEITPKPANIEASENRVIYSFPASENTMIIYHLIPLNAGFLELDISIGGDQRYVKQFVYL